MTDAPEPKELDRAGLEAARQMCGQRGIWLAPELLDKIIAAYLSATPQPQVLGEAEGTQPDSLTLRAFQADYADEGTQSATAYLQEHATQGPQLSFHSITTGDESLGWVQTNLYPASALTSLIAERDALRERLGPIDPGGSDRIDELEVAADFLRHRATTAEALASSETERADRAWNDAIEAAAKWHDDKADEQDTIGAAGNSIVRSHHGHEAYRHNLYATAIRTLTKETSNAVD